MADSKDLNILLNAINSLIQEFNTGSKVFKQIENNFQKATKGLKDYDVLLSAVDKKRLRKLTETQEVVDALSKKISILQSQSRQLYTFNEKFINSDKKGTVVDFNDILNTKELEKVLTRIFEYGVDGIVSAFNGELSNSQRKQLNKVLQEIKNYTISSTSQRDVINRAKAARSGKYIEEEKDITEEKKKQVKLKETELNIEEKIIQTKTKNSTKSKKSSTDAQQLSLFDNVKLGSITAKALQPPSVQGPTSIMVKPSVGTAVIPHPTLFKHPSTSLVPTGQIGSVYKETGEHLRRMVQRQWTDKLKVHNGLTQRWNDPIRMGTSQTPMLALPYFSTEEWKEREQKYTKDILPEVVTGSASDSSFAELRRKRARARLANQGKYQVSGTGSKEAIALGTADYNRSPNSFDEQTKKEEDKKNRRQFVTDLAIAIAALQKKNPLVDIIKLGILCIGKYFPVLSAALLTIAPLVGIFKGLKVLNAVRLAMTGGKVAKNAPLAAQLVSGFKGSPKLQALFGFGSESMGTKLSQGVWGQFKYGLKNEGIRGALSRGVKSVGVNIQSLPTVQKASGLFTRANRLGRATAAHPQMVGNIMKAVSKAGASKLLGGGLKLALGATKFAFRGLASPIMMAIDAASGVIATKGGKWWQRILGALLKIVTLGFMSDKKVRQIVGMKETDAVRQQQINNDEERRHQENLSWWGKFWKWLRDIIPWGKKDDPTKNGDKTDAPVLGAPETEKSLKDSISQKKKQLNSDKYKVGTKEYNKAIEELKKEYASRETSGYWSNSKNREKAYKEKLNSEEAQKYAINKLGSEAKALRTDIQRSETVLKGGTFAGGIMSSATGGKYGKGTFAGHNITSSFGRRNTGIKGASTDHKGIDLDYNYENVGAFAAGKVIFAGQQKDKNGRLTGYGNYVVVQDAGGMKHTYGHLSKIGVKKGQQVALGQSIGVSGNTGTSGGAHLHYGVQDKNNNFLNPLAVSASSAKEYMEALKNSDIAAGVSTTNETKKEQADSEIRENLAKIVGSQTKNNKQERTRNIVLSAIDVTGSLGVWGITQLNNGAMRTGR